MTSVERALEIVTAADLSPTEHLLLKHFVESAVDPQKAGEYVIYRVKTSASNVEDTLRVLKGQWRRLATRLTVADTVPDTVRDLLFLRDGRDFAMRRYPSHVPGSNVEPAYVIPPSLFRNLESIDGGALLSMLEAFLTSGGVSRLRDFLECDPENTSIQLRNLLLLPPSIHAAFRAGHVDIRTRSEMRGGPPPSIDSVDEPLQTCLYAMRKLYPEEASGLYLGDGTPYDRGLEFFELSTSDTERLPLPSSSLINLHSRGQNRSGLAPKTTRVLNTSERRVRLLPNLASPTTEFQSLLLHPPPKSRAENVSPGSGRLGPAFAVRALIERHTSIPAPRLLDTWETNGVTNILMTRVPGVQLGQVCHLMSYAERTQLVADLKACVEQLRRIPNTTPYLICDSLGGPITDHRIPGDTGGPFNTEADFNEHLVSHLTASFTDVVRIENLPAREHAHFYFAHSDFHQSNLLIERGRLCGIVDWESAGFKPEYWEFTKAMYSHLHHPVLADIFRRVFDTQYENIFDELVIRLLETAIRKTKSFDPRDPRVINTLPFQWDPPAPSTMAMSVRLLDRLSSKRQGHSHPVVRVVTAVVEAAVALPERIGWYDKHLAKEIERVRGSYRIGVLSVLVGIIPGSWIFKIIDGDEGYLRELSAIVRDTETATLMTAAYLGRIDHMRLLLRVESDYHYFPRQEPWEDSRVVSLERALLAAALGGQSDTVVYLQ
ncbi:aminoglycoside phosphotransferase family protein [Aspergillus mulundensis]|uniref:Aminoglycoside phosphotransferase domain-containing protein n=1 Tax=Aspergillus mulundensis TaxID=1810919 RepID=A0A3D8SCN0_9EURO|nr:hypothetical protein DSM5745_04426 [Aspergillus mulundensis]RDW84100.1 hypothetical protein DSM5745_04426 [Aspergillus mulundensis]